MKFFLITFLFFSTSSFASVVYETVIESSEIVGAIDSNQEKVVQEWLKRGHAATARINNKIRESLIDRAATHGSDRVFAVLLSAVNEKESHRPKILRDARGVPLLLSLVSMAVPNRSQLPQYEQMIELLLKTNPEQINKPDRAFVGDGRSALHQAAAIGNVTVLKALLKSGASVNITNSAGETPLHFAARFGQLAALRVLIDRGAKLNEKSKHTKATPLLAAAERGHEVIIRALIAAGANKSEKDAFGKTAPDRYQEYVADYYLRFPPQK